MHSKFYSSWVCRNGLTLRVLLPVSAIELEYSVDLGLAWHPLLRDCLPTNVECSRYHLQRILVSDTFNKWTRITLPLPPYTRYRCSCMYGPSVIGLDMSGVSRTTFK